MADEQKHNESGAEEKGAFSGDGCPAPAQGSPLPPSATSADIESAGPATHAEPAEPAGQVGQSGNTDSAIHAAPAGLSGFSESADSGESAELAGVVDSPAISAQPDGSDWSEHSELLALQKDKRRMLIVSSLVAIAFFMQMLDSTILNTALPSIALSLGESPLQMQSVVISYLITVALLIPASGWLADRFGAKKVFFWSIIAFCIGSCLCAAAWSLHSLVAARVAQGIGGAIMAPVGRLVIIRLVPRRDFVRVMSFITIPGLLGPLLGPLVGGVLVQYVSWHWIFLINVPIGLVGCVFTLRYMPALSIKKSLRFDWSGFLLFGVAMASLAVAVEGLGGLHLPGWVAAIFWSGGLLSLGGYVFYASRARQPLFRLGLFRNRAFSVGVVGNLFSRLGSGAMPFLMPLLLQVGLGYSPARAGVAMIPSAVGAIFSKSVVNGIVRRFGFRRVLVVNTLLLGGMIMSFSTVGTDTDFNFLLVHMLVFGMVNSMQFSIMNTATIIDLPQSDASSGNSVFSVVMQLSLSFGVSCGALLLGYFAPGVGRLSAQVGQIGQAGQISQSEQVVAVAQTMPQVIEAFHHTFICVGLFSILASATFFFMPGGLGRDEK